MPIGTEPAVIPTLNSVMTPAGVIRPMRLPLDSVNQRLPSGPRVMSKGSAGDVRPTLNSVTTPSGVMRPIPGMFASVNHRFPTSTAYSEAATESAQSAARALGARLLVLNASTESAIEAAFVKLVEERAGNPAVRAGRAGHEAGTGGDARPELRDDSERSDPTDPVASHFREPEVAVGTGRDTGRTTARGDASGKFRDDSERGDPPDPIAGVFREPQVPIGSGRDAQQV